MEINCRLVYGDEFGSKYLIVNHSISILRANCLDSDLVSF